MGIVRHVFFDSLCYFPFSKTVHDSSAFSPIPLEHLFILTEKKMDKIRELQKASGTGLKHSGRIGSLITPPTSALSHELLVPATIEFVEPGSFHVMLDSSQKRAATLKCGELIPYTLDEVNQWKATEYTNGRCVHVFRGFHRRGTTVREGPGSFHYGGGEVFEGRWRNNQRSGLGGLYLPSGYSYEGQFREDEPCGHGIETFPGGERYVGEFRKGKPHGRGTMYYVDSGSRYEGEWDDGEKHGNGLLFYDNGDIFEGTWEHGKRHGVGISTTTERRNGDGLSRGPSSADYDFAQERAAQGGGTVQVMKSYQSFWDRDVCSMKMRPLDGHVPPTSSATSIEDIVSPLGIELGHFQVVPDLWQQVHPAHFNRIKNAFESLDQQCTGEIEMDYIRSIWDAGNIETLRILERAATTVGDDNTLELIEVLTGLYPHLPVSEVRRWVLTDLTPEYLLKLRGTLADVQPPQGKQQDGFYVVSQGQAVLTKKDVEINKGFVGGVHITHSMFVRNRLLRGVDGMTFDQMLSEAFPNVWKEFLLRVEVTTIPLYALDGYLSAFRVFDESNCAYLSLEKMKLAQRRFQAARSSGHQKISMPTSPWEEHVTQGIMKHQARWLLGDISLTVSWVKHCDRARTGYVSLAEILRQAFPNVPCYWTKERLVSGFATSSKGEDVLPPNSNCECSICCFCVGPEFEKPRPFSPYVEGSAVW